MQAASFMPFVWETSAQRERERETGIPISALRNYCLDDIATSGYCETVKTMTVIFVLRTPKSSKFKEFG